MDKKIKPLLIIGGVFIFSIFIKLKSGFSFFGKENVLTCFDCFLYARYSQELLKNSFYSIDYIRNVPDFSPVGNPPLISIIPSFLSKLSGINLEIFFITLPPIFSVLFIIPLYFWSRKFAPIHVFFGGALLGIFNLIYFNRTSPGRFDTDSLILFFVFLIILLITQATQDIKRSYVYIFLAGIIFNLFMWWYKKPIFSLFFVVSIILGLYFAKDNFKSLVLKVLVFITVIGPVFFVESVFKSFWHYLKGYIFKDVSQIIPVSIFSTITELKPVTLNEFVTYTTDNFLTLLMGLLGLIILFIKNYRYMVISLPFILIGLTAFFAGNRFIMYISPFIGMGLGYIFYLTANYLSTRLNILHSRKIVYIISALLVIFFSFPPQRLYAESEPIIKNNLWVEMKKLDEILEKNSYIWTWWDYGYFLQYLLNRGTYVDNGNFNNIKLYFFSHSLMIDDEKKSRNLIAFVTNNLYKDYGKNIKNLTDTWNLKDKAYKYGADLSKPVYVFLFGDIMQKTIIHNLGVFGTGIYDPNVASVSVFQRCDLIKNIYNCGLFKARKNKGIINWSKKSLQQNPPYKEVIYIKRGKNGIVRVLYENKNYPHDRMLEIIETPDGMYFLIGNRKIKDTILNRMFIFGENFAYFKKIYDRFPYIVVYKVVK